MLVSLNGKWKIPIGYFFQNKLSAVTQVELIRSALSLSHNAGLRVWGVTCDGKHPVNSMKVYYIPDACHMLKLARNVLGNNNVLESNSGSVKWFYIE